jgi:hypothetical protein
MRGFPAPIPDPGRHKLNTSHEFGNARLRSEGLPCDHSRQMLLRVLMPLYEIKQIQRVGLMRRISQPPAKQLVP